MSHRPRNVDTWARDVRGDVKSPFSNDDDTAYFDGEAERRRETAKATASLEGKDLSVADKHADTDDPWKLDYDESEYDDHPGKEPKKWIPGMAPPALQPKRGGTTKSNELQKVTEPEWDADRQTWSTGSMKMQEDEVAENLQKKPSTKGNSTSHDGNLTERPRSQLWACAPSDIPSWVASRDSQNAPEPTERELYPMAHKHGNPYEPTNIGMSTEDNIDPNTVAVQRPRSSYQPDRNRDILRPQDSISWYGMPEALASRLAQEGSPGERTSLPPQLPPTIRISPSSSNELFPKYFTGPASRDVEMKPIFSIPPEKTPEAYRPEQPLNGRTAWLHALVGFLVVFNCWGITNAFGLFQAYYEEFYLSGTSPSSIAWIGSTQLCLVFGLGVPVGRLVDKGYFAAVFHSGALLMCLGLLCTSWCSTLGTLWLVQGLITGMGMGMVFCAGLLAMMTWFDEKRLSSAMALCAAGSCVGGIIYILIARELLVSHGFGTTMRVLAAITFATMIPANCIFRVRGQRNKHFRLGHRKTRVTPPPTSPPQRPIRRSFLSHAYLLVASGMFFSFLGIYFGFVYIISYGSTILHMSQKAATNLLIFMLLANLPGRFLPALIADRCIGPLNTIIPSLFLSSAVIWLWAAGAQNTASLTVIACFYGFVSAGIQVLYAPTMYSFCVEKVPGEEEVSIDKIGIRAGGISTCIGLACLFGTPIGGALISYRTDRGLEAPFMGAQIFAGVCLMVGGVLLLASRVSKAGWVPMRV